jgi:hypothetical protein
MLGGLKRMWTANRNLVIGASGIYLYCCTDHLVIQRTGIFLRSMDVIHNKKTSPID